MKSNKNIIIFIFFLAFLSLFIGIYLFYFHKPTYSLEVDKNSNFHMSLSSKNSKDISFQVEEDNVELVFSSKNNQQNPNYFFYILKDKEENVVGKGLLDISNKNTILLPAAGSYTLSILYQGENSISLDGEISIQKQEKKVYSTLVSGDEISKHIDMLTGREFMDHSITSIKIASSMNPNYADSEYIVSTKESTSPIYLWKEEDTLYFYSTNPILLGEYSFYMFSNLGSLIDINDLQYFDTSQVVNMDSMFYNDENLSDIKALSSFDTKNVVSMNNMFRNCTSLMDITPLISFETSHVKEFTSFLENTNVVDMDALKYFDVSNCKSFSFFFAGTSISNLEPIKDWDVSSSLSFAYTFYGTPIKEVDALRNWNMENVVDMSSIFNGCVYLENIDGLRNWNTASLQDFSYGLEYTSIENLDALHSWNTNQLKKIEGAFYHARSLKNINGISNWNVSKVDSLKELFYYTSITNVDALESWNVSNVKDISSLFSHTKLEDINGLKNWDVSKVENYQDVFDHTKVKDFDSVKNWSFIKF